MQELSELEEAVEISGVERVRLTDFRNYERLDIGLNLGFHVVAGSNAQGKTNLLEALYLLSTTRLLRGMRDGEAVRQGADRALVEADLVGGSTTVAIQLEAGVRKRALLNGVGLPRAADLIGRLMAVCVSSADLPIVAGEPSDRRLFLDIELSQIYPGYLRALSNYKRALEQRNALLKQAQDAFVHDEAFEVWEVQMADHGAAIRDYRRSFVAEVARHAEQVHARLGSGEQLHIGYVPKDDCADEESLFAAFTRSRGTEIQRGTTLSGPHRDDLLFTIEGKEARLYGSQGQQRSAVIATKLATYEHMRDVRGAAPLLLLDDMLSDLDAERRAHLCAWVADRACQALLTCTEASGAGKDILERATVFEVHAGIVEAK